MAMAQSVFQPLRLRMARELHELTQGALAKQLGVTPAAVSQFETGATPPGADAVKRMGKVLDTPIPFFYMSITDTHEGFFRSLRRTSVAHRRRARALAQVAHDIAAEAGSSLPPASIPHDPVELDADRDRLEEIAGDVRTQWGIPSGPAPDLVGLLEQHGALVIRLPLDSADVDAFSLPFHDRPVVVLGSDKNDRARSRFDAAHELGHLVAHGDQLWGVKEVEQQAHQFAAAFLMPADDIALELPTTVDWPTLFELKRTWQVSLAALLMRAKTLDRLSDSQYLTAVKAASARGWRRVEPVPLGRPERPMALETMLRTEAGRATTAAMPGAVVDALAAATAA